MSNTMRISVVTADRTGLIAAIAGRLFDLGANLGDTTFAVLGEGAEFVSIADMPAGVRPSDVKIALASLPEVAGGQVDVAPYVFKPRFGPSGHVTHRITVSGGDQPGLVARLAEAFGQYGANIVHLEAQKTPDPAPGRYLTRFAVFIPDEAVERCVATVRNTAESLNLTVTVEKA
ncbi:MAG TPA: ACT domain-containing protein [Alphaproteobacteria bacterium]|nr:ACT domain-containing protein [Alphaproteobacteria bacterium]